MAAYRYTRRRWLATCAGATAGLAAIAGCSDETDTSSLDDDPGATASDGDYGDWPMESYNATNRLAVPHSGVSGKPTIEWTVDLDSEGGVEMPVVYDDLVYVSESDGKYTAIDIHDGDTKWEHETSDWVAPAVSEDAVFIAGDGIEALHRQDGDILWATKHDKSARSLRTYDSEVYAGLGDKIVVLDEDGEERYTTETGGTVHSLAVDDRRVYARSILNPDEDEFLISAYDRDGGKQMWKQEISHAEQWHNDRVTRTFPVVDGNVYTVTDTAAISIDGSTGDRKEITELDHIAWTRPTIHNGRVYFPTAEMTYDLESGDSPGEWDPNVNPRIPYVAADGMGITTSFRQMDPYQLLSIDLNTGGANWQKEGSQRANVYLPIVLNGLILILEETTDGNKLVAYS
ncbi:outer membrane protein assembly factor BamB family protein [Natrarchaeobaculum sulfurireducens]|uniref:Putative cell surface protein/ lipoprotein n=1 Tax=Natrarchaeobaculum sulfurireducens TaxID=2044521 RepID=A0A346PQ42_9EURY|nr:PQQ-binding-like beta-propeller repeat protein [Natrarchaeobaculum sulfurireducens]AXR81637.1 putative cell surface protein/ lipoprotein [Natrarchaeobaculum sulfurireducens]